MLHYRLLSSLFCFLMAFKGHPCYSQHRDSIPIPGKGAYTKWSVSINPFSVLELQSAAGIGIGYRLDERLEIWSESSILFPGIYYQSFPHLKGAREILQVKYFFGKQKNSFAGIDARWKQYSFNDSFSFYDPATGDTLRNFGYRLEHPIWGGGIIIGQRIPLSRNHHFFLEATTGVGFKYRSVIWKDVPPGYIHTQVFDKIDTMPFTSDMHTAGLLLYVPATLRLYYIF